MNYAELSVAQHQRAKEFSKAQTDAMAAYCDAERDLRELQTENAKLRELVRHIWRCMHNEYTEIGLDFICNRCGECEYDNGCGECAFSDRMAELGIEVES